MEAKLSSEMLVYTTSTRRHIQENSILQETYMFQIRVRLTFCIPIEYFMLSESHIINFLSCSMGSAKDAYIIFMLFIYNVFPEFTWIDSYCNATAPITSRGQ
jgi:hypothetical protein